MGDVQGIHGANCRHHHGPGDGKHNPWEHYDAEENRKLYDLQQEQRALERKIRRQKREVMAWKTTVDNLPEGSQQREDANYTYQRKAARLQELNKRYNSFCEEHGLKPLRERLKVARWDKAQAAAASGAARKYIPPKVSGGKLEKGTQEWYDKRNQEVEEYYERVRGTDDVGAVAKSSGMDIEEVRIIKNHVFYNRHIKYDGEYERFDPDYDMAVAWKRLSEGNPEKTDIMLLKHELLESQYEKQHKLTASQAHEMAEAEIAWDDAVAEKLGEFGEADGLLQ